MNEDRIRCRNKVESLRVAAGWCGMTLRQYARTVTRLMRQTGMTVPQLARDIAAGRVR